MKKLIISICFVLLTSSGFAMSSNFETKSPLEAANFLASESIIVDRSNNPDLYELENSIQRQAVIKIVMKLSGKTITNSCRGDFSDVDTNDWPCKYIEAALDAGYITPNDTFRPYDYITLTEAMKLVLKSKGIEKTQITSNWQEDYMMTAYEYGIIDQKYYNYNDNSTRGWIFQIATATIQKEEEIKIKQEEMLISDEAL